MVKTESVERARERLAARLEQDGFFLPKPDDYAPREGAFALKKNVDDSHSVHVEAVFGKEGRRNFFRLNLGFGRAEARYDELPFLGDREGKGIRMPFFRVMMFRKPARFRQRFYNLFLAPPSWNHAASDTFYYESDSDLDAKIDEAASLVSHTIPRFVAHLERADFTMPRLKSPYRFPNKRPDQPTSRQSVQG
ncbi:MAG: hypothetical protein DRP79_03650 [Planctomycetota bacterium]|nr:MAG: hypothetical protein DRP79_03650 [Planctomycetota bacterium]